MKPTRGVTPHGSPSSPALVTRFPASPGVGLHHLSPRPGHLVISFQMPFPDSHTSQEPRSNTASLTSPLWWAELRGLLQRGCAAITPSARPRTRRATFTAPGANEQIPQGWRPRGVGLGSPWRSVRREKTGGCAGGACPRRPSLSHPGQAPPAGSGCRTSFSCCPKLMSCAEFRTVLSLSGPRPSFSSVARRSYCVVGPVIGGRAKAYKKLDV